MTRPKGILFTEATGKTVSTIRYHENPDWQAIEVLFTDGTLFSFELSSRVTVEASHLKQRGADSALIRRYRRVSVDPRHQT